MTKFWIGDTVYHAVTHEMGIIGSVQIDTDRCVPRYWVNFGVEHGGQWTDEMMLSSEKVFSEAGE